MGVRCRRLREGKEKEEGEVEDDKSRVNEEDTEKEKECVEAGKI